MPSETYQPKKFKRSRSRRSRIARRFYGLLGLIAVFFAITATLDHLDETPRWARVIFPTLSVNGLLEPFFKFKIFFINSAAGGVLSMKS